MTASVEESERLQATVWLLPNYAYMGPGYD